MKRNFDSSLSFLDVLSIMLLGFITLFILAVSQMRPPKKEEPTPPIKSNFVISIEWPGDSPADVDLFLQLPSNKIVFFNRRDVEGAALDRDDLGTRNDKIRLPDGSFTIIRENWEHMYVRRVFPGKYRVNVVMYNTGISNFAKTNLNVRPKRVPVKVRVEQLRPYRLIFQGNVFLQKQFDEVTAVRFSVDDRGLVKLIPNNYESLLRKVGEFE